MASLKFLTISVILTCMLGLVICWYAFVVEMSKELDDKYEAMCDISEHMSCSKVLTSPYGRGFGLIRYITGENSAWNQPNPIFGAALYISILMLTQGRTGGLALAQVILSFIANIGSVYLAIILFAVLKDFCIVCVSTYAVNLMLLILTWLRYQAFKNLAQPITVKNKKNQ